MPEDMPEDMSEYMPEDMSDRMPEDMSEYMPEDMPDRMPEDMSDRVPEDMPDRMPEDLPDRMPEDMPEDMPDHMPEDMPDRMSNRMSEDMSDRMPEDLPVRKCINVMVGITRSKVFFFCMVFLVEPSLASMASFALRKVCRCCGWMGEALQGIVEYCKPSGYVVVGSMIMALLERQVQFCNLLAVPKLTLPNGLRNLSLHRSMCTFRIALGWICKFEDRTFRSCKHIPCLKEFVFAVLSALFGSMSFNKSLSQFSISLSGTPSVSKHTPGTPPPKF